MLMAMMRKEREVTGLERQIKKNLKSGNRDLAKRRERERKREERMTRREELQRSEREERMGVKKDK